MATVNRNSDVITNAVATPVTVNKPLYNGALRSAVGYVANAADDSATSIHRFVRVPSNACIRSVMLSTGDATTAGAINLGVYRTAGDGGAVVDADLFAAAFALTNGPYDHQQLAFQSGEYTKAEAVKPLWEVLGLTADPGIEYDIAATISTTYNAAAVGQLLEVQYVV